MISDLKRIGRSLYLFVLGVLVTVGIAETLLGTRTFALTGIGLFCSGYLLSSVITRWSSGEE